MGALLGHVPKVGSDVAESAFHALVSRHDAFSQCPVTIELVLNIFLLPRLMRSSIIIQCLASYLYCAWTTLGKVWLRRLERFMVFSVSGIPF